MASQGNVVFQVSQVAPIRVAMNGAVNRPLSTQASLNQTTNRGPIQIRPLNQSQLVSANGQPLQTQFTLNPRLVGTIATGIGQATQQLLPLLTTSTNPNAQVVLPTQASNQAMMALNRPLQTQASFNAPLTTMNALQGSSLNSASLNAAAVNAASRQALAGSLDQPAQQVCFDTQTDRVCITVVDYDHNNDGLVTDEEVLNTELSLADVAAFGGRVASGLSAASGSLAQAYQAARQPLGLAGQQFLAGYRGQPIPQRAQQANTVAAVQPATAQMVTTQPQSIQRVAPILSQTAQQQQAVRVAGAQPMMSVNRPLSTTASF